MTSRENNKTATGAATFGWAGGPARGRGLSLLALSLTVFVFVSGCGSAVRGTDEPAFQRRYGGYAYCAVEVVGQSRTDTCGPACLASVLAYWDVHLSEERLLEKYPTSEPRPYLLVELRGIAEAEGLKAYAVTMADEPQERVAEQIAKGRPLICAVRPPRGLYLFDAIPIVGPAWRTLAWFAIPRKDHFVVAAGLGPERVLIMDPVHGFVALPWRRFEGAWAKMKHACLLVSQ